jgi:hypothetical protein
VAVTSSRPLGLHPPTPKRASIVALFRRRRSADELGAPRTTCERVTTCLASCPGLPARLPSGSARRGQGSQGHRRSCHEEASVGARTLQPAVPARQSRAGAQNRLTASRCTAHTRRRSHSPVGHRCRHHPGRSRGDHRRARHEWRLAGGLSAPARLQAQGQTLCRAGPLACPRRGASVWRKACWRLGAEAIAGPDPDPRNMPPGWRR